MKARVGAFKQEKALGGPFSVITNLRMDLFQALLQEHYLEQVAPQKRTFLQSALAALTGTAAAEAEQPRYGWWTAASDEEEEGSWGWRLAGAEPSQAGNITDSLWFFFGRGEHGTVNIFGDDDCGVLVDKDNFEKCVDPSADVMFRCYCF